jgi:hypothetical protein
LALSNITKKIKIIGGPDKNVQIDETFVSRRKNHKSRCLSSIWIVGGICEETGELFLTPETSSSQNNLEKIIQKYITPGTIIKTDCWAGYGFLDRKKGPKPFIHKTVNHRNNFVNPEDGTNTQKIERLWLEIKEKKRRARGFLGLLIGKMLAEFEWKQLTGNKDPFIAAIELIEEFDS